MALQKKFMSVAIALALSPVLGSTAIAAESADLQDSNHPHRNERGAKTLDSIKVTASPLNQAIDDLARPVDVLAGETLDDRKAGTLGETVNKISGVQSSFFGAGVGRPIVRGLDGPRVQVLNGGISSLDVSTVSVDHAVTIEPFLADQIEVLKGPANLLFGSGAIGGAVNVVDGRIPMTRSDAIIGGRAELRYGSGNRERTGMLRLDGGSGPIAWHVDGFLRTTDDYEIPRFAFSEDLLAEELAEGEDISEFARDELPNSALDNKGGAFGASYLGERGWFGASVSRFDTNYGIPPGAHAEEDMNPPDPNAPPEEEEDEIVRLDMNQTRIDARGGLRELGFLDELNFRVTNNDYQHVEFEGSEVGTQFFNDAIEARIEAVQTELAGWRGAFGLQYGDRDFEAIGEEAFVPASTTRDLGIFVMQQREFADVFRLEIGGRYDRVKVRLSDDSAEAKFSASNLSVAGVWEASDVIHLSANLDRAQRAPTAEELFSDGPHIATQSFEIGDVTLDTETANRLELGIHLHFDRFEGKLAVYQARFSDFIYLIDTDLEEDDLPVRLWTAGDARFTGWEVDGTFNLADNASGNWDVRLFADAVRAKLDDGGNLPRIAPGRIGLEFNWQLEGWRAGIGAVNYRDQDDVAVGEESTEGSTLVDLRTAHHWDTETFGWEVFVDAKNLTDEEARAHTSFLKEFAPLPGRSINAGLRVFF